MIRSISKRIRSGCSLTHTTTHAHAQLEGIRAKEELLARSREDYVDAYRFLPSRASDMTDQERDQIDQVSGRWRSGANSAVCCLAFVQLIWARPAITRRQLMASFIIKCGSQIEIIRCALAGRYGFYLIYPITVFCGRL